MITTSVAENRWLALVATLPVEDPAARMRALRMLEALGAAVLREGVYLLPDSSASRRGLDHLAEYIGRSGGSAQLLAAAALGEDDARRLRGLFDRSARYAELVKAIESLRVGFGIADPGAIARILAKQRRDLEAIAALDFFPNEARAHAERTLARAEAQVRELLFSQRSAHTPLPAAGERPLGRVWATRTPLWADRLACAWLVRRFVDPEAVLRWLAKEETAPPDAIGFAFDGASFANRAGRVTFEVLLAHFGLDRNEALAKIGAIVHSLEVRDAALVPEAAGVQTLLRGATRRASTADALLAEAEKTFDLLYDAYEPKR
jgi:hypothetical protein